MPMFGHINAQRSTERFEMKTKNRVNCHWKKMTLPKRRKRCEEPKLLGMCSQNGRTASFQQTSNPLILSQMSSAKKKHGKVAAEISGLRQFLTCWFQRGVRRLGSHPRRSVCS